MKVKTSELNGVALDWAVGYARCLTATNGKPILARDLMDAAMRNGMSSPSTDWAQGGPIIESELIHTYPRFTAGRTEGGSDVYQQDGWAAYVTPPAFWVTPRPFTGPTPLTAAMRCFCCAKIGDIVDVPEELCQQQSS